MGVPATSHFIYLLRGSNGRFCGLKRGDKSVANYCVANHQREVEESAQLSGGKQTSENQEDDRTPNSPTAQTSGGECSCVRPRPLHLQKWTIYNDER